MTEACSTADEAATYFESLLKSANTQQRARLFSVTIQEWQQAAQYVLLQRQAAQFLESLSSQTLKDIEAGHIDVTTLLRR
jgi:hypothetical protein